MAWRKGDRVRARRPDAPDRLRPAIVQNVADDGQTVLVIFRGDGDNVVSVQADKLVLVGGASNATRATTRGGGHSAPAENCIDLTNDMNRANVCDLDIEHEQVAVTDIEMGDMPPSPQVSSDSSVVCVDGEKHNLYPVAVDQSSFYSGIEPGQLPLSKTYRNDQNSDVPHENGKLRDSGSAQETVARNKPINSSIFEECPNQFSEFPRAHSRLMEKTRRVDTSKRSENIALADRGDKNNSAHSSLAAVASPSALPLTQFCPSKPGPAIPYSTPFAARIAARFPAKSQSRKHQLLSRGRRVGQIGTTAPSRAEMSSLSQNAHPETRMPTTTRSEMAFYHSDINDVAIPRVGQPIKDVTGQEVTRPQKSAEFAGEHVSNSREAERSVSSSKRRWQSARSNSSTRFSIMPHSPSRSSKKSRGSNLDFRSTGLCNERREELKLRPKKRKRQSQRVERDDSQHASATADSAEQRAVELATEKRTDLEDTLKKSSKYSSCRTHSLGDSRPASVRRRRESRAFVNNESEGGQRREDRKNSSFTGSISTDIVDRSLETMSLSDSIAPSAICEGLERFKSIPLRVQKAASISKENEGSHCHQHDSSSIDAIVGRSRSQPSSAGVSPMNSATPDSLVVDSHENLTGRINGATEKRVSARAQFAHSSSHVEQDEGSKSGPDCAKHTGRLSEELRGASSSRGRSSSSISIRKALAPRKRLETTDAITNNVYVQNSRVLSDTVQMLDTVPEYVLARHRVEGGRALDSDVPVTPTFFRQFNCCCGSQIDTGGGSVQCALCMLWTHGLCSGLSKTDYDLLTGSRGEHRYLFSCLCCDQSEAVESRTRYDTNIHFVIGRRLPPSGSHDYCPDMSAHLRKRRSWTTVDTLVPSSYHLRAPGFTSLPRSQSGERSARTPRPDFVERLREGVVPVSLVENPGPLERLAIRSGVLESRAIQK